MAMQVGDFVTVIPPVAAGHNVGHPVRGRVVVIKGDEVTVEYVDQLGNALEKKIKTSQLKPSWVLDLSAKK
jgi:hypothetical protein